jgi:hypothetical protein
MAKQTKANAQAQELVALRQENARLRAQLDATKMPVAPQQTANPLNPLATRPVAPGPAPNAVLPGAGRMPRRM